MNSLLQWDKELFLYLNSLGTESWDHFWMFMTGNFTWAILIGALFALSIERFKKRFWIYFLLILVVYGITDWISVHLFKDVFQRLRPCHVPEILDQMRLVKGNCGGQYGFVSSHAANSMAIAWLAGLLMPIKWGRVNVLLIFLLSWAAIVSYSRVYVGVHYPGDIIAGAILGKWIALIFYGLSRKFLKKS